MSNLILLLEEAPENLPHSFLLDKLDPWTWNQLPALVCQNDPPTHKPAVAWGVLLITLSKHSVRAGIADRIFQLDSINQNHHTTIFTASFMQTAFQMALDRKRNICTEELPVEEEEGFAWREVKRDETQEWQDMAKAVLSWGNIYLIQWDTGKHFFPHVLVSARIELIFFLVAGTVLCFGFSRKIMLITH